MDLVPTFARTQDGGSLPWSAQSSRAASVDGSRTSSNRFNQLNDVSKTCQPPAGKAPNSIAIDPAVELRSRRASVTNVIGGSVGGSRPFPMPPPVTPPILEQQLSPHQSTLPAATQMLTMGQTPPFKPGGATVLLHSTHQPSRFAPKGADESSNKSLGCTGSTTASQLQVAEPRPPPSLLETGSEVDAEEGSGNGGRGGAKSGDEAGSQLALTAGKTNAGASALAR